MTGWDGDGRRASAGDGERGYQDWIGRNEGEEKQWEDVGERHGSG